MANLDTSIPEWILRSHSFADSLVKGAQVGSIIANNRYRNQALAAQVMESERNYDLREKQLNAQIRTEDLNYQLQSQLIEDRTADKATLTDYFKQMAPLSLQERVALPPPTNLRLLESYRIVNQVSDNNRLAYAQTEQGKAADRIQYRIRQLPSDYQYLYDSTQDPEEKHRILQEGEAEMERRAEELRAASHPTGVDASGNLITKPFINEKGEVEGHAFWSGNAWVRIPTPKEDEGKVQGQFDRIRYQGLQIQLNKLAEERTYTKDEKKLKFISDREKLIKEEMQDLESRRNKAPSTGTKAPPAIGEIRDGYEYKGGDPADKNSWQKVQ